MVTLGAFWYSSIFLSYHLLFELHMILRQMDIKLFRRENGHFKGILIFVHL